MLLIGWGAQFNCFRTSVYEDIRLVYERNKELVPSDKETRLITSRG